MNMFFLRNNFYSVYQDDFHKIKAVISRSILSDLEKYFKELFHEDIHQQQKESIEKTLRIDLRQNYFHPIETFFEIFFSLTPW